MHYVHYFFHVKKLYPFWSLRPKFWIHIRRSCRDKVFLTLVKQETVSVQPFMHIPSPSPIPKCGSISWITDVENGIYERTYQIWIETYSSIVISYSQQRKISCFYTIVPTYRMVIFDRLLKILHLKVLQTSYQQSWYSCMKIILFMEWFDQILTQIRQNPISIMQEKEQIHL